MLNVLISVRMIEQSHVVHRPSGHSAIESKSTCSKVVFDALASVDCTRLLKDLPLILSPLRVVSDDILVNVSLKYRGR